MTEHFQGGSAVPGGYYLNASRWAVVPVARDGDRLPPGPGRWRRVPMVVALALVPVLGVTFLMFMPVAGFVVRGQHLWGKVRGLFVRAPAASASSAPPAQGDRPPAPQG
jgi:hypothetical protein